MRKEPISARPDTLAYRAAKFVRRHRVAVVLATLGILATAAGVVGTLVQARRAREQRDFALHQLSRAEAINEFNEFLLSDAAPSGKPFTVNELLGARKTSSPGSALSMKPIAWTSWLLSATSTPPRTRTPKLAGFWRRPTYFREDSPEVPPVPGLVCAGGGSGPGWRTAAREALFQEGLSELGAQTQYALDRVFCLQHGSEVAQERGDPQAGIARMQAAQAVLKQSPFDSDMKELHMSIDLAEAYRMAGQNQEASTTFEQAAGLLLPLGRDDTQTAVVIFNDWALAHR